MIWVLQDGNNQFFLEQHVGMRLSLEWIHLPVTIVPVQLYGRPEI
jgi:hypothetical protein